MCEAIANLQAKQVKQQQWIEECSAKILRAKEDVASAAKQIAIETKEKADQEVRQKEDDLEKRKNSKAQQDDEAQKRGILLYL